MTTTTAWLIAPIAIPLTAAVMGLILPRRSRVQRGIGLAGSAGQLAAAIGLVIVVGREGILVVQAGNWPAPFGITVVADHFSALLLLAGALAGFASLLFAAMTVDEERMENGYFSLACVLLAGVAGAFLTGDLFNLYVWFEVMLIASFILLAFGRNWQQAEGAATYVTLNLIASAMFLTGAGLAYAITGSLNFAEIAERLPLVEQRPLVLALAALLLIAFATKAAAFPLSAWLPVSYHTPNPDVSALFAGLLTKVGVYALARTVTLFAPDDDLIKTIVLAVAGLTMVVGVLGALAQLQIRRLLSFHIASQVGYMLLGIGLMTPLALAGAVFYMAQHMITKTSLFLVSGVIEHRASTGWLPSLGGLYRTQPLLAAVFALAALALAGIPPLAGFVAKYTLTRAAFESEAWALAGIALAVSLLTLLSMVKIWVRAFWTDAPDDLRWKPGSAWLVLPAAILAIASASMGFAAGPMMEYAMEAGRTLADSTAYRDAVLGATR